MRVAILESIIMPAGHEVEFDRILVNELKRQGHEPVFFVPRNFPFKVDYGADIVYLDGGEVVTYAGAPKWKKPFLSLLREKRRRAWFNSAAAHIEQSRCDALIIPTATYRYIKAIADSALKDVCIPVHLIFHGIGKGEMESFHKQVRAVADYKNLYFDVISLRTDMLRSDLPSIRRMLPPVFTPVSGTVPKFTVHSPVRLGFFGQFRKEKNIVPLLEAFVQAEFNVPVEFTVQGATAKPEDGELFDSIIEKYKQYDGLRFIHENLIGEKWDAALLYTDAILMPYGAERYRYHWSAMLYTAIGFNKPVFISPEINPEVIESYRVGECADLTSVDTIREGLEAFVNTMCVDPEIYREGLREANLAYSHAAFLEAVLSE